ncbi:MAG TPA: toll/interleukin-1 receptor domain-containing protein [Pyrinomonadaceae bacterium]|jgi:hypothetical protein|nr:toll/interleukin-1 receptor domain-containing protein [Pyrinomonadaceae bacterium]
MKVFLSWSGEMSQKVATALRDWLPLVIQSVKPFISNEDIDKGVRWSDMLAKELNDTSFGIICITPYNVNSSWMNFEAGAISKAIDRAQISPFLFRIEPANLKGPLSQFQATRYDKEDILRLLMTINERADPATQLSHELLKTEFDVWWPNLKSTLDKVTDNPLGENDTGYRWLLSASRLHQIQGSQDCKEIWVITPNLYQHSRDPGVRNTFVANLERGTIYRFIIPSSGSVSIEEDLREVSDKYPKQVLVKQIPLNDFHKIAVTDYVILNPNDGFHVFLELPISAEGYWIEVDGDEATLGLVARFRELAEQAFPCINLQNVATATVSH